MYACYNGSTLDHLIGGSTCQHSNVSILTNLTEKINNSIFEKKRLKRSYIVACH